MLCKPYITIYSSIGDVIDLLFDRSLPGAALAWQRQSIFHGHISIMLNTVASGESSLNGRGRNRELTTHHAKASGGAHGFLPQHTGIIPNEAVESFLILSLL